jgi:hypothetical protein
MSIWEATVYIFRICAEFVYNFFSEQFMLTETVSAWDFLMLCFVIGGIITLLVRSYGGSGTSGSGSSANGALARRNRNDED